MLKSDLLPSTWNLRTLRASSTALCLLLTFMTCLAASGQAQFTVQMSTFPSPAAVDPGGTSAASITVTPQGNFSGTVDLTCAVTPQPVNYPDCQVSPATVAPPANASATVTTTVSGGTSPPGQYAFTITGTLSGTSVSASSQPQYLTVLAVTPSFTITVERPVEPSSVHAGSGGEGTVDINPLNGYTIPSGGVQLFCATITPLVNTPPECSFNPNPVLPPQTSSTLSINTVGPITAAPVEHPRFWFAFALPLPLLALGGAIGGKRVRRAWCLFAVFVLAGTILLMPGCAPNNNFNTNRNTGVITPKNNYTFTLSGVDANGVSSTNTGTSAPTVSLTVD